MEVGRSWLYKQQVERRRKNRLKGPQLYDLARLENDIRQLEWKRLESIHEANAEDAEDNAALFDLNLGLKEFRDEWNKAVKQHAVVAVTYLARYHPMFRRLDVRTCPVFNLIYRSASMPPIPDTGPEPTLYQLWTPSAYDDGKDDGSKEALWRARSNRAKRRSVLAHYDRVY